MSYINKFGSRLLEQSTGLIDIDNDFHSFTFEFHISYGVCKEKKYCNHKKNVPFIEMNVLYVV